MPLYEYECEACGNRFERIQKFSDPLVDTCPVCGGPVKKLLSSPAIQFKGSGWYITDYARKAPPDSSAKAPSASSASDSKSDAKSDAKATAKSDTSGTTPKKD